MSGKRKTARNVELKPWLSANLDNRDGRFIQVGNSLLLSENFQELGSGARYLFLCMAMESGGKKIFAFPHRAAKKYGIPASSFERHTKELIQHGFIILVKNADHAQYSTNHFSFTLTWKGLNPTPHFGEGKK